MAETQQVCLWIGKKDTPKFIIIKCFPEKFNVQKFLTYHVETKDQTKSIKDVQRVQKILGEEKTREIKLRIVLVTEKRTLAWTVLLQ